MADKICIISLNVRGLRARDKRLKLFKWLKETHKADVVFLQETHSTFSDEKPWTDEWEGDIYFSHGEQNARGVCIMTKVSHTCHKSISSDTGRHIMIDVTISDRRMTIMNIYAPNLDDAGFIQNIIDDIESVDNDDRIVGGDFNCVLDDKKDKKGGVHLHANQNMKHITLAYMDEAELIDIWRKQHPNECQFTFHSKVRNQFIFSRLDYFIISFGLSNLVESSHICPSILTDHSLIKIKICLENNPRGPGFWKFNCSLLSDQDYVQIVKHAIRETVAIEDGINPDLLWETIKLRIRTDTIQYSSRKKRCNNNALLALNKRLTRLEYEFQQNPNDEDRNIITLIKQDIDDLLQNKINGIIMRSKCDWQEYGEKPSKFFLSLEKRNFNNKTIKRLRLPDGTITMDETKILNELKSFYSTLYTTTHNIIPNFRDLDHIPQPTLNIGDQQLCEGPLSQNEVFEVLKTCKKNKSPGTDGFPAEFYKFFWNDIKEFLLQSLNYTYAHNKLSITQRDGLITLIPKKDKDTMILKNWRPITLLNQDYKLASKTIAKRLCTVLPKIINSDQTGFLKNRYIGENIIRITNIMDYLDENNQAALLLSADFEKAFDCLEWKFVEYCLNKFNFGHSLIKWVKLFHTDITTKVSNNGWTSEMFYPTRGSRQGCPLSPYIFLICAEMLASMLRNNPSIHGININDRCFLVSQYADDTLITLDYSEQVLREIVQLLKLFATYSGLRVNYEKSEIMPLGRIKHQYNKIAPECNFRWTGGPIRSLGVDICHRTEDLIKLNYTKALKKMENILKFWGKRYLTLYGKVVVINTFIISQFVYLLSVLPSPTTNMLKEIQKCIFEFVWGKKPDKIKRDIMKLPKDQGGIGVPDIILKDLSLKVTWIKRIMSADNTWNVMIQNKIPVNFELFLQMNMSTTDVTMITANITNRFMKDVLFAWSRYNFHPPTHINQIRKQVVWFNSHIKINNNTVFIPELYDHNICYIHQFFDNHGNILSHDHFQIEHGIDIIFLTYYGIISAIPRKWKLEMKINHMAPHGFLLHRQIVNIQRKDHICKYVYNDLIEMCYGDLISTGLRKWNDWLPGGLELEEWRDSFKLMYQTMHSTKTLIVQFKILHNIIATKEKLFQWGMSDTDVCSSCNEDIETLPHLLVECEVVKIFWNDLKYWLQEKTDILIHLTMQEIILGLQNENLHLFNCVYLLAKQYLYMCSLKNMFPQLNSFKKYVSEFLNVEQRIAIRREKLPEFLNVWNAFLPIQ